jgi:DNA-binding NarL/FixJ family response regulator
MGTRSVGQNLGDPSIVDLHANQNTLSGNKAVSYARIEDSRKTRTFVAAENRLLRETLSTLLMRRKDLEIVGQSSAIPEMAESLRTTMTSILLLNSTGSHQEDLLLVRTVREMEEPIRIVMMGMKAERGEFLDCVRAGATGYLLMDASTDEVVEAIRVVREGGAACPTKLCMALFQYCQREMRESPSSSVREQVEFTRKEQQILRLVAQGMTNKEIAQEFRLSEQTVKNHLYRMNLKAGTEDRRDMVRYCRARGVSL